MKSSQNENQHDRIQEPEICASRTERRFGPKKSTPRRGKSVDREGIYSPNAKQTLARTTACLNPIVTFNVVVSRTLLVEDFCGRRRRQSGGKAKRVDFKIGRVLSYQG